MRTKSKTHFHELHGGAGGCSCSEGCWRVPRAPLCVGGRWAPAAARRKLREETTNLEAEIQPSSGWLNAAKSWISQGKGHFSEPSCAEVPTPRAAGRAGTLHSQVHFSGEQHLQPSGTPAPDAVWGSFVQQRCSCPGQSPRCFRGCSQELKSHSTEAAARCCNSPPPAASTAYSPSPGRGASASKLFRAKWNSKAQEKNTQNKGAMPGCSHGDRKRRAAIWQECSSKCLGRLHSALLLVQSLQGEMCDHNLLRSEHEPSWE